MQRTRGREPTHAGEMRLRELLVSALAGSEADYHAFLTELSARLRAFLRKRLANLPNDVEDLVQETLLAIHNQRHTYDPAQPLTPWVHAIAKYKLVDLMRSRATREMLNDPLDDETDVLAVSDGEARDARHDIEGLLEQLPEGQRVPIVCTKLNGLSVKEAAKLTGMTESAIKVGVHRGLKALAAKLRE